MSETPNDARCEECGTRNVELGPLRLSHEQRHGHPFVAPLPEQQATERCGAIWSNKPTWVCQLEADHDGKCEPIDLSYLSQEGTLMTIAADLLGAAMKDERRWRPDGNYPDAGQYLALTYEEVLAIEAALASSHPASAPSPEQQEHDCKKLAEIDPRHHPYGPCDQESVPSPKPPTTEPTYACADCGRLRTKSEGGTVFTVCDECWDKRREPPLTDARIVLAAKIWNALAFSMQFSMVKDGDPSTCVRIIEEMLPAFPALSPDAEVELRHAVKEMIWLRETDQLGTTGADAAWQRLREILKEGR